MGCCHPFDSAHQVEYRFEDQIDCGGNGGFQTFYELVIQVAIFWALTILLYYDFKSSAVLYLCLSDFRFAFEVDFM